MLSLTLLSKKQGKSMLGYWRQAITVWYELLRGPHL